MSIFLTKYLHIEILEEIFKMIRPNNKIFLNKKYYLEYNNFIDQMIDKERYDSYLRDIIRNDYNFVFKQIIARKIDNWNNIIKFKYKEVVYSNYLYFLLFYSNKNNSYKCNQIINDEFVLSGLKKKSCKSSRIKNNKWMI